MSLSALFSALAATNLRYEDFVLERKTAEDLLKMQERNVQKCKESIAKAQANAELRNAG